MHLKIVATCEWPWRSLIHRAYITSYSWSRLYLARFPVRWPQCGWNEVSLVSWLSVTRLSHEPNLTYNLTSHWRSGYNVKIAQWKSFLSKLCVILSEPQTVTFCTEITFISKAILILSKGPLIMNNCVYLSCIFSDKLFPKFEDPTAIHSWVISSDISHRIPLTMRLQPLRMRRITSIHSGKFFPHMWNPWLQFVASLYNFFGVTIKINGVIWQNSVWPCVKDRAALCARAKSCQPGTLP